MKQLLPHQIVEKDFNKYEFKKEKVYTFTQSEVDSQRRELEQLKEFIRITRYMVDPYSQIVAEQLTKRKQPTYPFVLTVKSKV